MFKIIVLVCSVSTPPNNCNNNTAVQSFESPEFSNSLECNNTQPWLAKLANKPIYGKEYPKIICPRIKNG